MIRALAGLVGTGFLVVVFWRGVARYETLPVPGWSQVLAAQLLVLGGLWAAGRGWAALFGSGVDRPVLFRAFFESQLGKYVPGGIWQPLGQVGLATEAGISLQRAAVAFPVHGLTQLASALTLGAGVAFLAPDLAPWLRAAALAGLLSLALLRRAWMARTIDRLRGWLRFLPASAELPAQAGIVRAYGWGLLAMLLGGAAFSVLVGPGPWVLRPREIAAFCFAWAVGFAALPFPSGLGVREATLILVSAERSVVVVAASVGLRLVTIVGELAAIAATAWRARRRTGC